MATCKYKFLKYVKCNRLVEENGNLVDAVDPVTGCSWEDHPYGGLLFVGSSRTLGKTSLETTFTVSSFKF
jgi:hypothetical protein